MLLLALAAAALAAAAAALALALAGEDERPRVGAYVGARNPDGVAAFASWLGRDVGWALEFIPADSWSTIARPDAHVRAWADSPYAVVYSVPLLPDEGGSLQEGAAGAYDEHFRELGRTLVRHGQGDAVLRLGWEFNGGWFRWSAAEDPDAFAAYWRRVVDALRSVPGAGFRFDWCPTLGREAVEPPRAYPGDAYVDYIGVDVYDQGWFEGWEDAERRWRNLVERPFGLRWHREFARARGKPVTFPEWGLADRPDGHGGGDSPLFVERMHAWIVESEPVYHLYWNFDAPDVRGRITEGRFPRAGERFRTLFAEAA